MNINNHPKMKKRVTNILNTAKFEIPDLPFPLENNPEQNATEKLLEISNQQFQLSPLSFPSKSLHPVIHNVNQKIDVFHLGLPIRLTSSQKKGRASVAENYTQSHKMCRKDSCKEGPTPHELLKCQIAKRSALNPSNFMIFENEKFNNLQILDINSELRADQKANSNHKFKFHKNIASFIRRRSKSKLKEQENNKNIEFSQNNSIEFDRSKSPSQAQCKISKSCELSRWKGQQQQQIPLKIVSPSKMQEKNCIQFQCTSPNFRNKRFLHYRQLIYANISARSHIKRT